MERYTFDITKLGSYSRGTEYYASVIRDNDQCRVIAETDDPVDAQRICDALNQLDLVSM